MSLIKLLQIHIDDESLLTGDLLSIIPEVFGSNGLVGEVHYGRKFVTFTFFDGKFLLRNLQDSPKNLLSPKTSVFYCI